MGDFGPLYRALKRAFQQKLRYNFPKMKGGGGGGQRLFGIFPKKSVLIPSPFLPVS